MFALLPPVVVAPRLYVSSATLYHYVTVYFYMMIGRIELLQNSEHPKFLEIRTVRVKREFEKIEIQPVPIVYHLAPTRHTR